LVCFGKKTWIKIKEIVRERPPDRENYKRRVKEKATRRDKATKRRQCGKCRVRGFSLDGIKIRSWWEKESWAMVTDPENPFGDLTREEQFRIAELKRMRR
jgi:hypothetical protein